MRQVAHVQALKNSLQIIEGQLLDWLQSLTVLFCVRIKYPVAGTTIAGEKKHDAHMMAKHHPLQRPGVLPSVDMLTAAPYTQGTQHQP